MNTIERIKTIYVHPGHRGPGGTMLYWMAYYDGQEHERAQRGWGTTARDAEDSLRNQPIKPKV